MREAEEHMNGGIYMLNETTTGEKLLLEFVETENMIYRLEQIREKKYSDIHPGKEIFISRTDEIGYELLNSMISCYTCRKWELFMKIRKIGPYKKELYHMDHHFHVVLNEDFGYVPVNAANVKDYEKDKICEHLPYMSFEKMVNKFIEDGIRERLELEQMIGILEEQVERLLQENNENSFKPGEKASNGGKKKSGIKRIK